MKKKFVRCVFFALALSIGNIQPAEVGGMVHVPVINFSEICREFDFHPDLILLLKETNFFPRLEGEHTVDDIVKDIERIQDTLTLFRFFKEGALEKAKEFFESDENFTSVRARLAVALRPKRDWENKLDLYREAALCQIFFFENPQILKRQYQRIFAGHPDLMRSWVIPSHTEPFVSEMLALFPIDSSHACT